MRPTKAVLRRLHAELDAALERGEITQEEHKMRGYVIEVAMHLLDVLRRTQDREVVLEGLLRQVFVAQQKGESISWELCRAVLNEIG